MEEQKKKFEEWKQELEVKAIQHSDTAQKWKIAALAVFVIGATMFLDRD